MNADDRATTQTPGGTFKPQTDSETKPAMPPSVQPTTGTNPQRTSLRSGQIPTRPATGQTPTRPVTGQTPTASSSTPASTFAPSTGQTAVAPRSSSFAPAPTTGATPVAPTSSTTLPSTTEPSATVPSRSAARLTEDEAEVESSSKVGSAFGKLKGAAARAKEEVASADPIAASAKKGGPRKVRVLVSRVDPWSALKIGFLLSIAAGIMLVVAVFILWSVLNSMGVWMLINDWILRLFPEDSELDLLQFFDRNKIMAATTLIAVVNVVLLTAMSTISAFLYNVISSVVGGFYVTLTDD